ncbi:hypothetical protein ABZY44_01145 [Streptomyces sp. NPDC006544]|uniref:hypothetical protein n=1 Tax=Streptomyces sp. NPDC006544 TaxID=3154583 RepID=UPI0033A16A68
MQQADTGAMPGASPGTSPGATLATPGASPGSRANPSAVAAEMPFYRCMEEHGLTLAYRDSGIPRVVEEDGPRFAAAQETCLPLRPSRTPVQAAPRDLTAARMASECMRAQGIDWYPDPDPVTGEINQAAGGTPAQWSALKQDHMDAMLKCMPRP